MKKQLLIVWCIVVSAILYAGNSAENFLDLCVKHKDYLVNHEKDIGLQKKQQIAKDIKDVGDIFVYHIFRGEELLPFIEKYERGEKLTEEEYIKILSRLDDIGRVSLYHGMMYHSPVIKEEIIVKIMVCAIKNKETSKLAAEYLAQFSKEDLQKYSAEITDSVDLLRSNIKLSLLYFDSAARKKYADILRKEIVNNFRVNQAERLLLDVRLGNDSALDTMIRVLQTSGYIRLKQSLVYYLGVLGTDRCIIALLNAMNDNQEVEEGVSLRVDIIDAIQRNYPDDELFLKYFRRLFDDDSLGGKDGIALIYKELEQWAKDKFNYDLDLSEANPTFIDRERAIRKFYYPKKEK